MSELSSYRTQLGGDGRFTIPSSTRRELGLKPGDTLIVECDGVSLLVRSYDALVSETQAYFQQFAREGESVVDELIADRRLEAARDEADTQAWLARMKDV